MSSQAQIDANRRNAQRSTGPRTEEGKRRVSRNAITHGLDCRDVLLPDEDRAAFEQYRAAMIADHQPSGAEEQDSVERMVACQWRIRRGWRAEADVYAQASQRLEFKANAGTAVLFDLQNEKAFAYLDRREANLCRTYERSSRRLQELQDQRRKGTRHVIEADSENPAAEILDTEAMPSEDTGLAINEEQTHSTGDVGNGGATIAPTASAAGETRRLPEQSQLGTAASRDAA